MALRPHAPDPPAFAGLPSQTSVSPRGRLFDLFGEARGDARRASLGEPGASGVASSSGGAAAALTTSRETASGARPGQQLAVLGELRQGGGSAAAQGELAVRGPELSLQPGDGELALVLSEAVAAVWRERRLSDGSDGSDWGCEPGADKENTPPPAVDEPPPPPPPRAALPPLPPSRAHSPRALPSPALHAARGQRAGGSQPPSPVVPPVPRFTSAPTELGGAGDGAGDATAAAEPSGAMPSPRARAPHAREPPQAAPSPFAAASLLCPDPGPWPSAQAEAPVARDDAPHVSAAAPPLTATSLGFGLCSAPSVSNGLAPGPFAAAASALRCDAAATASDAAAQLHACPSFRPHAEPPRATRYYSVASVELPFSGVALSGATAQAQAAPRCVTAPPPPPHKQAHGWGACASGGADATPASHRSCRRSRCGDDEAAEGEGELRGAEGELRGAEGELRGAGGSVGPASRLPAGGEGKQEEGTPSKRRRRWASSWRVPARAAPLRAGLRVSPSAWRLAFGFAFARGAARVGGSTRRAASLRKGLRVVSNCRLLLGLCSCCCKHTYPALLVSLVYLPTCSSCQVLRGRPTPRARKR